MELNALVTEAHQNAVDAGWWEPGKEKSPLECHMLIISEVVEATEAVRNHEADFYLAGPEGKKIVVPRENIILCSVEMPNCKPEGEAVELADAVIRIMDWFGKKGWDMEAIIRAKMAYNKTRGRRHGGKAA